jgi:hypothetical protein
VSVIVLSYLLTELTATLVAKSLMRRISAISRFCVGAPTADGAAVQHGENSSEIKGTSATSIRKISLMIASAAPSVLYRRAVSRARSQPKPAMVLVAKRRDEDERFR